MDKKNKEVPIFSIRQTIAAILIFGVFTLYVWLIQLKYESASIGYERAFLFSLGILGAGFSYDCGKKILFLLPSQFKKFWAHFCSLGVDLFAVLGFTLLSGLALKLLPVTWVGQLIYLIALGWVWALINSATSTIEAVTAK